MPNKSSSEIPRNPTKLVRTTLIRANPNHFQRMGEATPIPKNSIADDFLLEEKNRSNREELKHIDRSGMGLKVYGRNLGYIERVS